MIGNPNQAAGARARPRTAPSRAAARAAKHVAAFDAQTPLAPEERRESQVKYIYAVCEQLNERGDTVELPGLGRARWSRKTLKTYISGEFGEGFTIDSLSFDGLLTLKRKLSLRLDAYNDAAPASS